MRIAFVSGGVPFGGSTIFLLHLVQGLRSIGIVSEIFSFSRENPLAAEFAASGTTVHNMDETKLIYEDRLTGLYDRIVKFKPTAVFANLAAESLEMLRYMPKEVARIAMIHEKSMHTGIPYYADQLTGIAIVNPSWVEIASQQAPGVSCRFLAHGIPLPDAGQHRKPNPADPLRIIYFGRLVDTKGTRLFPAIAKLLHQRSIPFHWAMYGSGPDEAWLHQQFASEIQAGAVSIKPHVSRSELYSAIRDHDVFIMASDHEGGPLTLLEAMAVGLVPICNDTPCLAQEVIKKNPENGFIIPRDPAKYVDTILELHQNRPCLERMSAAARNTITAQYSLEAMARRYVEFIKSIAPEPIDVSWPARIHPKPIRGLALVPRIGQSNSLTRQLRRLSKRIRR